MANVTTINVPQGDFVTTNLIGSITSGSSSFTIGSGLNLDANGGFLTINYDSTNALGTSDSPETIAYTGYNSGTGAVTGVTRAQAGTTAVAHSNSASVQAGTSAMYLLNGNVLGYAQITSNFTTATNGSFVDVTNLAVTVTVPAGGRRVKLTVFANAQTSAITGTELWVAIQEGGTVLGAADVTATASATNAYTPIAVITPTAASHTYKVTVKQSAAGTITVAASATEPAFILAELI